MIASTAAALYIFKYRHVIKLSLRLKLDVFERDDHHHVLGLGKRIEKSHNKFIHKC